MATKKLLHPDQEALLAEYELAMTNLWPATRTNALRILRQFFDFIGPTTEDGEVLARVKPRHKTLFFDAMKERWCDQFIEVNLDYFHGFAKWLTVKYADSERFAGLGRSLLDARPTEWHFYPKLPKVATVEQAAALMAATATGTGLTDYKRRVVVCLGLQAGLRVSEVATLRWDGVDLDDKGTISVVGKGGKPRRVPILDQELYDVLTALREQPDKGEYVVRGGAKNSPVGTATVNDNLKAACDLAGIEQLNMHSLRHRFAQSAAERGVPITAIRDMLGHSSLQTTHEYLKNLGGTEATREAFYRARMAGER